MKTRGSLLVADEDLEQERPVVRSFIKRVSLPELLVSMASGPYGLDKEHLLILEVLETAGAHILELCKKIRHRIAEDRNGVGKGFDFSDKLQAIDERFCNFYAVYVAADFAAARAKGAAVKDVKIKGAFTQPWVSRLGEVSPQNVVQAVIGELSSYLDFYRNRIGQASRIESSEDLVSCTVAFFSLLAEGVKLILSDAEYERHIRVLSDLAIEVSGRRYAGLNPVTAAEDEEPGELLPVFPEDIVGNREYLAAGLRLARDVAGFDFVEGRNPKRFNPILFGQGAPGCGKTVTAHAIGNYFLAYCREREVPARFLVIRRTDWASSYQNASANRLVKIFKEQVQGYPGVVGVYWPDIDTAFAARSDPGLRSEEANILGASFGIFDGTLIPRNGKWFLVCDANYMNMDEATLSRITQDPYKIYGPQTSEDYVELMRDKKLVEFSELLQLSEEQWAKIGDLCIELGLSGRNVDNICQKVIAEMQDVEPPVEYYKADFERRKQILRELAKPLTYEHLVQVMEGYKKFEKAALEAAEKERFQRKVQEIVLNLSARKAASQVLG